MQNQWMGSSVRFFAVMTMASLVFVSVPGLGVSVANAQRRPKTLQINMAVVLMAAPREVLVLLEQAEAAIRSEQWSEATFTLGVLLGLEEVRKDDLSGIDFFLEKDELSEPIPTQDETNAPNSHRRTVFQRVYELIESLPAEATKIVDLRYGLQASQLLEKAIIESDWNKMAEVVGKYGFTTAGQDATVILGQHWLRKGDARRAARLFSRACRQKSANERLGPELGILAASTFYSVGRQSEALSLIESTRTQFNKLDLNWKGSRITWDSRSLLSKEILDSLELSSQKSVNRIVKQPHYQSGSASRNADTNAGIPLPILRWHTELHESKQHKDNLELTLKQKLAEARSSFIPSRYPICVGQWVIVSTYDQRIVAIDTLTGRLGWECFYSGMPLGFSMDKYLNRDSHSFNLPAPDYLAKRVWGESLLGAISSDGERIYSISELPAVDVAESFALGPNASVGKPQGFRSFNVMQCWSVREEGKIKWEIGGQKSQTEPKLAGMLFLGSPLPHENELLVMGELNSDLYLLGLAPETGKLLWRQPLTTNYGTIALDPMRRSAGAMPAADGSIIVCPTLSGYLIAYDKATRSMLWAFKYQVKADLSNPNQVGVLGGRMELADFSPLTPRSADTSVVISDGVVLFAPSDGSDAYAIRIEDGTLLWKLSDSKVDNVRYVAGEWNGIALFVCQSSMLAIDLKSGVMKWPRLDLPDSQQVIGRGVRKEGTYLLPTSGQNILRIDLASGVIAESVRVEQPLGNLISVGDRLICATPFELDCYTVREAFQTQLKEELQRNSHSPSGLAQQGELALANGDFDNALNFLDQARKIDPKNAEIILLINKAGIAALTDNFDRYFERVNLFENLAIDRDKIPYLRLMVKGLQKQGRYKETLATLLKLSRLRTSQRQEQMSGIASIALTPGWSVQEDRWIATQVSNSINKLLPAEIAEIKTLVAAELVSMSKLPSHIKGVKLGHFESIRETESIRLAAAIVLAAQRDYLQAERLMTSDGLLDISDPKSIEAKRRKEVLASVYVRTKRLELAARYVDGDPERLNKIIREAAGNLSPSFLLPNDPNINRSKSSKSVAEWPTGKVQVTTGPTDAPTLDKTNLMDSTSLIRWKTRIGDSLLGWQIHSASTNFVFSNSTSGESFQIFAAAGIQEKNSVTVAHSVDSIVLLEIMGQIIAVDTLRGSSKDMEGVLWREQFEVENPVKEQDRTKLISDPKNWGLPTTKGEFRVASVSRNGIIIIKGDELSCLDLTTGSKLWTRTGFQGCSFASQQGKLFVYRPKNRLVLQLDVRDGTTLDEALLEEEGLSAIAAVGRHWLMEKAAKKENAKPSLLCLVDSVTGRLMFKTDLPTGTKIALDGETGVIILKPTDKKPTDKKPTDEKPNDARQFSELVYWNISEVKEFVRLVEREKVSQMSVQRFGDTMLVMIYHSSMQLDNFQVSPDVSDTNFVPVAGRVIALSAKDASIVWEQNPIVRQFFFPISQNRNSPVATFVRMLKISKLANKAVDFMSIAMIDIRSGRILYNRDDLPAIRGLAFSQEIIDDQNTIVVDYLGTRVELNWTKEPSVDEPLYDFGNLDYPEFKKRIEARTKAPTSSSKQPSSKLESSPNK